MKTFFKVYATLISEEKAPLLENEMLFDNYVDAENFIKENIKLEDKDNFLYSIEKYYVKEGIL